VQNTHQDKWHVTHMATYLKCGNKKEEKFARVKDVSECLMPYLSESVGDEDELCYPFEEAFCEQVGPGLFNLLETDFYETL
jgi:hypothetical protein